MQDPPAGTIGAPVTGRKIVPTLAATASREPDAADVSGGARLHYSHRPPRPLPRALQQIAR
jgi:hypothetical protein